MKKSIVVCLVVATAFLSQGLFADSWGNAKLIKTIPLTLADETIVQLNIDVSAGDLSITGNEGQSGIVVTAKVFGEESSVDDYVLSLEKEGDKAVLIAQFRNNSHNNERIDLEVTMSPSLALLVHDRSGDISIESVSNGLTLNDRSGDVVGKNFQGDVIINDRSGEIQLKDVFGDLNIEDSSGDIRAKNISGVVTIEDSSGDIDINGAADFKSKNDGSGDVSLRNINRILK